MYENLAQKSAFLCAKFRHFIVSTSKGPIVTLSDPKCGGERQKEDKKVREKQTDIPLNYISPTLEKK